MKTRKILLALLLASLCCLGVTACGNGGFDISGDTGGDVQPSTVYSKTGTVTTDNWGDTGVNPVQVPAPTQAAVEIKAHTILEDVLDSGYKVVVSGVSATKVSFSTDLTTLSAAAQGAAPANFASYINVVVGTAKIALPAYSITVDAGAIPAGETVTVYNYDAATKKWISPQLVVVGSGGKITFDANRFSLYGVFRSPSAS